MGKHHQQRLFLGQRQNFALIQLAVAAGLPEEVVKGPPQRIRLGLTGMVSVGQEVSVELTEILAHELRNEIKQSKQTVRNMRKYLSSVKREKGSEKGKGERREWMQKEEQAEQVQKEQISRVLCGSHESKAKELGKCGRKAMKSDRKRWSTGGTSVTS